ncbi:hypothetical protein [Blautia glucerasea]|uniref:hypothetical protein n=1 Tax=Blautia glucerasea TaxID=536633 RepID=UPI003A7F5DF8
MILGSGVSLGSGVTLGSGVSLGSGVTLGSGVSLGSGVTLGSDGSGVSVGSAGASVGSAGSDGASVGSEDGSSASAGASETVGAVSSAVVFPCVSSVCITVSVPDKDASSAAKIPTGPFMDTAAAMVIHKHFVRYLFFIFKRCSLLSMNIPLLPYIKVCILTSKAVRIKSLTYIIVA